MGSSLLLKGGTNTPRSIVESFSLANAFSPGDAIRYDIPSSTWVKAQADSAENSEVAGIVSAASFNTFDLTYSGYIQVSALSGVSAPVLFLDSTIAGGLTTSPPSAIGTVIKPVLTKTTNGSGYIVTNYLGTQIGGSSTVAIDEIQPVGTVVPFAGSAIPDSWLECNGASYDVSAYPNLYAKLQYSSGDRAPAYGYVANITVGNSTSYAIGQSVSQAATGLSGTVLAHTALGTSQTNTLTVQVIPTYSSTTKNFVQPNAVFSNAAVTVGTIPSTISAVSVTHFNTPDLRGRFAVGANTAAIGELETDSANYSAISGTYSIGSEGGQEFVVATPVSINSAATGTAVNVINNIGASSNIANIPPYTVVRYIIKATPYTRAAIIDGIDIPYTSLLVSDLRDGSLRPGGSGEDLLFKTNDGTSGVERMRLTNTDTTTVALGSVLIGTNSPTSTYNNNYRLLEIAQTNGSGGGVVVTRGSDITLESGVTVNTGAIIGTRTAHPLIFRTNVNERMRIDANGLVNIGSTVDSTTTTSGGLTLGGGLGMALNLTVGGGISAAGGITFSGLTRLTNTTAATSPTAAALTVAGGIGAGSLHIGAGGQSIAGSLNVTSAGTVNMASTAASNSTTSGALTVVGGVGIQGALYVGGITTAGGISMGGALTVGGGITAATLNCSGQVKSGSISTGTFTATSLAASADTQSTATNIGALTVVGGAGIGKNLFVGGGITATGSLDLGSGAIRTSGSLNCGNIVSAGTFQANSLNASVNTTSTSTGSGSLVVAGGAGIAGALNVGGGISAGGGITTAGVLRVGATASFAGNVGIGTTDPAALLNLSGTNPVLNLESTNSVGDAGGILRFGHNLSGGRNPVAEIKALLTDSNNANRSGHLRISTSSGGSLSEKMRITSGGNVGIGTSSPTNKLHIQSTTANTVTGVATDGGVQQVFAYPVSGGNVAYSGAVSNHAHALITNNLPRLWITNDGNIGIGTSTPNGKLEIVGAAAAEAFRVVSGTSSQVGVRLYEDADQANFLRFRPLASPQTGFIFSDDGDTPILTIQTATDRVGIGTSAPTQALDVVGSIVASGAINSVSVNATGLSKLARLSVYDGTTDLNSGHRISAQAFPGAAGAVLGYSNNQLVYGILGWNNTNSFLGLGTLTNTGALNNTGTLTNTGEITATGNITAFSDIRGKENISTIENGLSKTLTLNGVLFTDKETQQRRTGLIAQDVLAVLPEAVSTNADGYYSLAYGNLVGLLVQAIKELNAKVDSLSAKVETLSSGGSE